MLLSHRVFHSAGLLDWSFGLVSFAFLPFVEEDEEDEGDEEKDDDEEEELASAAADSNADGSLEATATVRLLPTTPTKASVVSTTAATSATSVSSTDRDRPQLLPVSGSPAAKRRKDSADEEEEEFLARPESPQCTTPDPLMRSIGVGPNLPLDVSNAAILFGREESAPEESANAKE